MLEKPSIDQISWRCELSDDLKHQLLDIARVRTSLDGIIQKTGFSTFNCVIYFISGVQTFCYTPLQGSSMVGLILGAGDWLGALTVGNEAELFILSEELQPIRILYFPGKELERLAQQDPHVYKWLFYTAARTGKGWALANAVTQHDKVTRAAYALMELASHQREDHSNTLRIKVSQQQLSDMSNISRPRLNEVLKGFENEGAITLARGRILINDPNILADKLKSLYTSFKFGKEFFS